MEEANPEQPSPEPKMEQSGPMAETPAKLHRHGIAHFFSDHPKLGPLMGFIALGAGLSQRHTEAGVWLCMACACIIAALWAHDIALSKGQREVVGTLKCLPFCVLILGAGWWLTQPTLINVTFKDVGSTTVLQRYLIARNITNFRNYLYNLGFSVPLDIPPLGIGTVRMKGTFTIPGGTSLIIEPGVMVIIGPTPDSSSTTIDRAAQWDMSAVRRAYALQLFGNLLQITNYALPDRGNRSQLLEVYSGYFLRSYAGDIDYNHGEWADALLDIRGKLGSDVVDRSMVYSYKLLNIYGDKDYTVPFNSYVSTRLLRGMAVMETDMALLDQNSSNKHKCELILKARGLL
jgi:hypothetical protein